VPPADSVRVEEFVNILTTATSPAAQDDFALYMEASPWSFGQGDKFLPLSIGLKARQISDENRKPAILTFVIDVSGSMNRETGWASSKRSLRLLITN